MPEAVSSLRGADTYPDVASRAASVDIHVQDGMAIGAVNGLEDA